MKGVDKSQQISFCIILLIIFILMGITTAAQENEYEFNLEEFKQKAFSLDGYVEFRPSLYWMNHKASFYTSSVHREDHHP